LAANINAAGHDGRISTRNKEWAKNMLLPLVSDNRVYYSSAHPIVVDGYIRLARKEVEKKPSILEALKQGADKSRQQPGLDKEQRKNKKGIEV
jgi:hypothetical protein